MQTHTSQIDLMLNCALTKKWLMAQMIVRAPIVSIKHSSLVGLEFWIIRWGWVRDGGEIGGIYFFLSFFLVSGATYQENMPDCNKVKWKSNESFVSFIVVFDRNQLCQYRGLLYFSNTFSILKGSFFRLFAFWLSNCLEYNLGFFLFGLSVRLWVCPLLPTTHPHTNRK